MVKCLLTAYTCHFCNACCISVMQKSYTSLACHLKCTTFHGGTMKSTELSYVSNNTHCRIKCHGINISVFVEAKFK